MSKIDAQNDEALYDAFEGFRVFLAQFKGFVIQAAEPASPVAINQAPPRTVSVGLGAMFVMAEALARKINHLEGRLDQLENKTQ
jgi:hypothetical protein